MIDRELDGRGVKLHALERNPTGAPAVLFCHGWLDHCRGFDWLIENLPASWRTIALDFRGHGRSGHIATGAYDLSGYCDDIDATLQALKLERIHLVGHSMGGAASIIYSAACPDRVQSLTLIEALGPTGGGPEMALARVQRFGQELRKPARRRVYTTLDDAIARVRENNSSLPAEAAAHMTRHGVRQTEGGFEFTFDPAVRRHTAHSFSDDQVVKILEGVSARTQVIRGSRGFDFPDDKANSRLSALKHPPVHVVDGAHHVHLERPREVAEVVRAFVSK